MARRKITESVKGPRSQILGVYGPSFGYLKAGDVVADLTEGRHTYYVREGPYESELRVLGDGGERRLVTTLDVLSPNNLENLPPYNRWYPGAHFPPRVRRRG